MTALSKPQVGTATLTVTTGSTHIGTAGDTWKIKLSGGVFDFSTSLAETTGDGDANHTYHGADLIRGQFQLQGFVVAGSAVGLANLRAQRNASTDAALYHMRVDFSAGQSIDDRPIHLERVRLVYREAGEFIGVSMSGRYTDDGLTSAHAWEGTPS